MAKGPSAIRQMSDISIAERLQSILINAALGERSVGDDRQYGPLRSELRRRTKDMPELLVTHPTVESFVAQARGIADKNQRVIRVQQGFRELIGELYAPLAAPPPAPISASTWTGIDHPIVRLMIAKQLLPLAQTGIDGLIAELSKPTSNNGPILDERQEAINNLRELYRVLGEVISAADSGNFEDCMGQGLAAEAVRYVKRAGEALRNDPMPFLANGLITAVLTACGFPVGATILGGTVLAIRKDAARARQERR